MQALLVPAAQKNLDVHISKLTDLVSVMKSDVYGANDSRNLATAERIKSGIQKGFIYPKIRNYLK